MENAEIINELERNASVIKELLSGLSSESYRWKPSAEKWNLLDVVSHFVDEEVEDFRARVGSILNDPSKPLQPFNPEAWVMERKYSENNFESKIAEFVAERAKSVAWLRGLNNPKWDNAFQHPKVGPVTAQLILENWLAHDILHIRQILGLKYGYLKVNAKSPLDYAGNW